MGLAEVTQNQWDSDQWDRVDLWQVETLYFYSEFSTNVDGSFRVSSLNSLWHDLFIPFGDKKITFDLEWHKLLSNSSYIIGIRLATSNWKGCKYRIIISESLHNVIGSLTCSQNPTTRIHTDSPKTN
jgi:hypothetical protein